MELDIVSVLDPRLSVPAIAMSCRTAFPLTVTVPAPLVPVVRVNESAAVLEPADEWFILTTTGDDHSVYSVPLFAQLLESKLRDPEAFVVPSIENE